MQCIHCGYQLTAFDTKCPRCGKSPNDPVVPQAPSPPPFAPTAPPSNYQRPGYLPAAPISNPNDQPSTLFAVLGFFFPVIGLLIYLVAKPATPYKASSALKGALWGFGSSVFVIMALTFLGGKARNDFEAANRQMEASQSSTMPQR